MLIDFLKNLYSVSTNSCNVLQPQLSICSLLTSTSLSDGLAHALSGDRYILNSFEDANAFLDFVKQRWPQIDCLILEHTSDLPTLFQQLAEQNIMLPAVTVQLSRATSSPQVTFAAEFYHDAVQSFSADQIPHIQTAIAQAITQFLTLSSHASNSAATLADSLQPSTDTEETLLSQQKRLSEKLKERLGYLGVYYKRNPANFIRHMTEQQKREFLSQLKIDYREIILSYFADDPTLNEKIDNFVNLAFFSDVPVSQIVGIHMELMDEFSKQLKLEGRSDEILLDYRLTLIDTIAHLCEMYRRSIPRQS